MFTASRYGLLYFIFILLSLKKCRSEPAPPPSLALWSPGELPHLPVLVRRAGEPLALRCQLHAAPPPRRYLWNFLPDGEDAQHQPLRGEPPDDGGGGDILRRERLRVQDTGTYICSAPPLSTHKYILVQPEGQGASCARGALSCGTRCVLPSYVCDGHGDCAGAEDEAPELCGPAPPCAGKTETDTAPDRLNCSSGRCIPAAACCRAAVPLCRQPRCCEEHPPYWRQDGYADIEFPPLFVDRHPPDDYSFIQSTIYTVTACALIFMIAVVLLVSAICKLHMKRAAARSRPVQYQARFPPCYEASRLLEQRLRPPPAAAAASPPASPCRLPPPSVVEPRGLARVAALFNTRYTQVPTQCAEVELQPLPSRPLSPLPHSTPRPLTLQLGRFRLSLPRLRRPDGPDRPDPPDRPDRPDTPTVAEIDIEELDFVRLTSHETYTLNGRTIRLLGGDFESYPPPYNKLYGPPPRYPSGEASGESPPRYEDLTREASNGTSRGGCNRYEDTGNNGYATATGNDIDNGNFATASGSGIRYGGTTDAESYNASATDNGILYEATAASGNENNISADTVTSTAPDSAAGGVSSTVTECNGNLSFTTVIDNLPAIDSDVNANDTVNSNSNGNVTVNSNSDGNAGVIVANGY